MLQLSGGKSIKRTMYRKLSLQDVRSIVIIRAVLKAVLPKEFASIAQLVRALP